MERRGIGRDRPGVMASVARTAVTASTARAIAHAQRTAGAEALRREEAADRSAAPTRPDPPAPPAGPLIDRAEQLVVVLGRLAELRDQGVLTEQEFADQKERLLSGDDGPRSDGSDR